MRGSGKNEDRPLNDCKCPATWLPNRRPSTGHLRASSTKHSITPKSAQVIRPKTVLSAFWGRASVLSSCSAASLERWKISPKNPLWSGLSSWLSIRSGQTYFLFQYRRSNNLDPEKSWVYECGRQRTFQGTDHPWKSRAFPQLRVPLVHRMAHDDITFGKERYATPLASRTLNGSATRCKWTATRSGAGNSCPINPNDRRA